MTEEKRNRIIAAVTINVILLIVILAAVLIYQMVVLSVLRARREQIITETEQLVRLTEEGESELEKLQSQWYLQQKLIEFGYSY